MPKEKVFSYVKDDDRVPMQKLSIIDQFFVLVKKLTFDASAELKRADMLTRESLKLKADLIELVMGATESIRKGDHKSVHLKVSSKFNPVIPEVLPVKETPDSEEPKGRFASYYYITIKRPALEYDVDHFIDVWLEVKR